MTFPDFIASLTFAKVGIRFSFYEKFNKFDVFVVFALLSLSIYIFIYYDLLYRTVCATDNCIEDYVGETARCIDEKAKDHSGRDQHSHLVKHAIENNHLPVVKGDLTIVDNGYRNNTRKRKIAKALTIKVIRPSINAKEKSVELRLFN